MPKYTHFDRREYLILNDKYNRIWNNGIVEFFCDGYYEALNDHQSWEQRLEFVKCWEKAEIGKKYDFGWIDPKIHQNNKGFTFLGFGNQYLIGEENLTEKDSKNNKKIDWILMSEIYSAYNALEQDHEWDLDISEYAKLAEYSYNELVKLTELENMNIFFKHHLNFAKIYCWGLDHTCEPTSKEEIDTFILCFDSLREKFKL